jgi:hypothetical protein
MYGAHTTDYNLPNNQKRTETDPNELANYALVFLQANLDLELVADILNVDVEDVDECDLDRLHILIDEASNHIGKFTKKTIAAKQKPKQKTIEPKTFVLAWINCHSIQELCEKLGIERNIAYSTATKLRNSGVKLPQLEDEQINF